MCTKSDEAEINATDNVAAAQADGDPCPGHEWVRQICPGGLFFDPITNVAVWPQDITGPCSSMFMKCSNCGDAMLSDIILEATAFERVEAMIANTNSATSNWTCNSIRISGAVVQCGEEVIMLFRKGPGSWTHIHEFQGIGGGPADIIFQPAANTSGKVDFILRN